MCDTLGFVDEKRALFAKNSDRSPNEPQILEYISAKNHSEKELKATYISVPQVEKTHAVLLSRPIWMWGAEMGVNDCGVCIGNEAVWTKGKYSESGLTGMDLLRLGLERADSAENALRIITGLLEEFGQGGNCGYDHEFYYDNSFLIMDRNNLYVLETSGKEWVCKKENRASISNRLSVGSDGDEYSLGEKYDFAKKHSDVLYNFASGSLHRKNQTESCFEDDMECKDMFAVLRTHKTGVDNPFSRGTVGSVCMHFGGMVGDHTTASMVADLSGETPVIWATGCSTPCVSFFKPWIFADKPNEVILSGKKYWYEKEAFRRNLLGKIIPEEYYAERDDIEQGWIEAYKAGEKNLSERCDAEEKEFFEKWKKHSFEKCSCARGFKRRWIEKNEIFVKERKIRITDEGKSDPDNSNTETIETDV